MKFRSGFLFFLLLSIIILITGPSITFKKMHVQFDGLAMAFIFCGSMRAVPSGCDSRMSDVTGTETKQCSFVVRWSRS